MKKKEKIAHITIKRPELLNALNMEARRGLAKAWADVRDDPEVWVAIVTGAGEKAFCVGQDLKEVGQLLGGGDALTYSAQAPLPEVDPLLYLEVWKPFIVVINGIATGAGLELALACEL
ncbi:MAG: enoyl-CoA hydratase-related protein [Thermodesulfobacteriota bacterium]|nr:enoyl-CoA hydratase-related protein [Thermodesulfobacteriota bacterium]